MVLVPLLAAPSLMLAASAAERRFGPAIAGAVVAAPVVIAIVVLTVGLELGRTAGAALASGAAAHVIAQVAFALAFAAIVTRRGAAAGFLAGALAFAAVSLLTAPLPPLLAIALAFPALLLQGSDPSTVRSPKNPCSAPDRIVEGSDPSRRVDALVGAATVVVVVAVVLQASRMVGPGTAGAISAFPALSGTLALLITHRSGAVDAARALRGMLRGLRGYLAFCVTAATLAPAVGVAPAVLLAFAAAALTQGVRTRRLTACG